MKKYLTKPILDSILSLRRSKMLLIKLLIAWSQSNSRLQLEFY